MQTKAWQRKNYNKQQRNTKRKRVSSLWQIPLRQVTTTLCEVDRVCTKKGTCLVVLDGGVRIKEQRSAETRTMSERRVRALLPTKNPTKSPIISLVLIMPCHDNYTKCLLFDEDLASENDP